MIFSPIPLPYADNALEPYISQKTMDFHYRKHHAGYASTLNNIIVNTKYEDMELKEIVISSYEDKSVPAVFNNAAQLFNHNLFWLSMSPSGGGKPKQLLMKYIEDSYEDFNSFIETFKTLAISRFGSGWAWLSFDTKEKKLKLSSTSNGDTPLAEGFVPIIALDVWEHAYYLDYQNRRKEFIDVFFDHLVNWDYAEAELQKLLSQETKKKK